MDFTLAGWKQSAADKLKTVGAWLERRRMQDAPYLLYGMLCALSLWPLVEAAQAGQFLPVVMALGSVAGGVGGNLLAEQVQRWKDRAGEVDEEEVAAWAANQAAADPELRQALDAILDRLETIPQAQAALDEGSRAWFVATLREEVAQLGSQVHFEATVAGSGAVAQGAGAQAAGERGVVARDIAGPVVTGDRSAAADGRGASTVGDGNIVITGDVQGGVTILPRGQQAAPAGGPSPAVGTAGYQLAAVRNLLLNAFSASDLRRLFVYTANPELRPLVQEFGANDGLAEMADKAIEYCLARDLLPDLLREIERANPRQYGMFADQLGASV